MLCQGSQWRSRCCVEQLVETLVNRNNNSINGNPNNFNQHFSNTNANRYPSNQWGCPPPAAIFRAINSAVSNADLVTKKSKSAVLERLPEGMDEKEAVRELAEKCELLDKIDLDNVHRHGKEKNNGKARIIKIPFQDSQSRNQFLYSFRQALHGTNFPKNLSARRDMLPNELTILYDLRREAYELNKQANARKYIVVDLEIRTLNKPIPFNITHGSK